MNNGEDCPRCLGWTFDDEPCGSMLCQGIAEGRRLERAAIVAWLRAQECTSPYHGDYECRACTAIAGTDRAADKIERGEHEEMPE